MKMGKTIKQRALAIKWVSNFTYNKKINEMNEQMEHVDKSKEHNKK